MAEMNFRIIKQSIIDNVLAPEASTYEFVVIGYQKQSKPAEQTTGPKRTVQVYFKEGDFPKSAGRPSGPVSHNLRYKIELTVSSAVKGDLSVINNPDATALQLSTAISAFQNACALVDEAFDEFADFVWNVFMDGKNFDLGLDKGVMSNRWISNIQKDDIQEMGGLVTLTGSLDLTCRTSEQPRSVSGTAAKIFDTEIDIDGDDVEKTGVKTDNT